MNTILNSYLQHLCGAENVFQNVPLSTKTTFRIGGAAKFFVTVRTKETLVKLVSALNFIEEKFFIIGNGSNVLAPDEGYDGVVIKCAFADIVQNGNFVYADAGVSLGRLCAYAREHGLGGLEWACAIPATVGGAVYMNAGAHGGSVADSCVCVDVFVGDVKTITADKLGFSYRTSIFQRRKKWIITGAYFYLKQDKLEEIAKREDDFRRLRASRLPTQPSAGSTFRRPFDDFYVGKVVEELGLKGKKEGGAQISDKHAGVIVNAGGATKADVMKLVNLVKKKVRDKHGVNLKLEYEEL